MWPQFQMILECDFNMMSINDWEICLAWVNFWTGSFIVSVMEKNLGKVFYFYYFLYRYETYATVLDRGWFSHSIAFYSA